MSGVAKAFSKVFKAVGHVVQKVWKPLVIAAAIYFTGGAALGAMGALGAGGGVLAGAGAGLEAAAGGIGIGAGAGIGGAFAAGAGTAAAEGLGAGALAAGAAGAADLGGAGVLTAEGAADAGIGGAAASEGSVLGADSVLGGTAGLGGGGVGTGSLIAGTAAGAEPGYGSAITNGANYLGGPTAPGAPSSMWDTSLGVAKSVLSTPGVPSLIGGLAQGLMAGNLQNAQMKWAEAHAPGQIAGGAGNAWGGFATNKNLTPTTPMPANSQLPPLTPYKLPPNQAQAPAMPGVNQPGSNSANYPGYGTPGYGQQFPPGTQPFAYQNPGQVPQDLTQQQGLLSQQTPFIESPYDESYV